MQSRIVIRIASWPLYRIVTFASWRYTSLCNTGYITFPPPLFRFFYSNTNYLVQLDDTIKTERGCSMQRTERTTVPHHRFNLLREESWLTRSVRWDGQDHGGRVSKQFLTQFYRTTRTHCTNTSAITGHHTKAHPRHCICIICCTFAHLSAAQPICC